MQLMLPLVEGTLDQMEVASAARPSSAAASGPSSQLAPSTLLQAHTQQRPASGTPPAEDNTLIRVSKHIRPALSPLLLCETLSLTGAAHCWIERALSALQAFSHQLTSKAPIPHHDRCIVEQNLIARIMALHMLNHCCVKCCGQCIMSGGAGSPAWCVPVSATAAQWLCSG